MWGGDLRRSVRPDQGRPDQRNFGGHTYPVWPTSATAPAEDHPHTAAKIVSLQQEDKAELGDYEARIKIFHECAITELIKDGDRIARCVRLLARDRQSSSCSGPAVVLATGGIGSRSGVVELLGIHR